MQTQPRSAEEIAEAVEQIMARNRALYGGYVMLDSEDGADDSDDGDDDSGEDGDDGDDSGEDDGADWAPPSKEEWERTQAALKKANGEAKKNRLALREAAASAGKGGDSEGDSEDKVAKAVQDEVARWKPRVVNSAARAALLDAGANKPERLLKLLDTDSLDIDEEGSVDGLDDEVERLKEEYPELFASRRRTKVETGDRSGETKRKTLSATERQAAALLGS